MESNPNPLPKDEVLLRIQTVQVLLPDSISKYMVNDGVPTNSWWVITSPGSRGSVIEALFNLGIPFKYIHKVYRNSLIIEYSDD